jgi:hypothetical protein
MGIHAIVAAVFLCALIVEWGSHNLAFAHAKAESGLVAVGGAGSAHIDPCGAVVCFECRRSEQSLPRSISHDAPPCRPFADVADIDRRADGILEQPSIPRRDARRIFRAAEPPHQPPQFS